MYGYGTAVPQPYVVTPGAAYGYNTGAYQTSPCSTCCTPECLALCGGLACCLWCCR